MRELKFRAWGKGQKKMHFDNFAVNPDGTTKTWGIFDHLEVMLYTGLKDKFNHEIYEGDIVLISLPGFGIEKNIVVEYGNGEYKEPMFEEYHRQIIGNIYQNPELLNQENK
jgi:hypothetical protein